MARLIDANALMDAFRAYMVERYDREKCVSEENCKTCEKSCLWRRIVSVAPTVDAVEVVHGRWLCVDTDTEQFFLCNRCKKKEFLQSNYCRSCGAKMDGGDDNGC